jgi:hypothetical protein
VLADADADAASAGLNRSEMVELALRNEHLRRALRGRSQYVTVTVLSAAAAPNHAVLQYRP